MENNDFCDFERNLAHELPWTENAFSRFLRVFNKPKLCTTRTSDIEPPSMSPRSTSVNEGELKSATEAAKTLIFLQAIIDFVDEDVDTPKVHCDNMGAIAIARGIGKRKRSKHIDTKHFYVRELITNNKLTLHHVDTDNNVSDAMTKSLGKTKFLNFRDLLKIRWTCVYTLRYHREEVLK